MKKIDPAITRFPSPVSSELLARSDTDKVTFIEGKFREILEVLGLDIAHDSLKHTPRRIAKMYVEEIFSGLNPKNFPEVTCFDAPVDNSASGIVLVKNIELMSYCEHHFVPIVGIAHVAYLPTNKVVGLSKVNRIVRYFARRPQLQERLTAQIADSLATVLETTNVAVVITAKHFCVSMRGVQDDASETTTQILLGEFLNNPQMRSEFFQSIPQKE